MSSDPTATLARIVVALSVTYTDEGVLTWLTAPNKGLRTAPGLGFPDGRLCSPREFIAAGRIAEVVDAVRRIGDADPSNFTVSEVDS